MTAIDEAAPAPAPAPAETGEEAPGRPLRHEDLWSIPVACDPRLSPDGRRIAYVVTAPDAERDDYRSAVWLIDADGGVPRRLTHGRRDSAPRWSPDGRTLAFLRAPEEGGPAQLHLLRLDGGDPLQVTHLPGGAGVPAWSPDGSRIAFAAPTVPEDREDDAPVVISRSGFKVDGTGLVNGTCVHLFVLDAPDSTVAARPPRQLTFGDSPACAPVWSPDSSRLAFGRAPHGDDGGLVSVVLEVGAEGGVPRPLSPPDGAYLPADWSPDGDTLLLIGQPRLTGGNDHLYALPAAGGDPVRLTPGYDRSVAPGGTGYPGAMPRYADGGERILFCAREAGAVHVLAVGAQGGDPDVLVGGDRVVAGMSARGARIAFVAATAGSPGELSVLADGEERTLTELFAAALPDVRLVEPEPVSFRAQDGTDLHGWILREASTERAPLLLDVHGGPHNAWGPGFDGAHLYHQTLAAAGWTVLTLNPRGSDGYGDGFRTAVHGAWGRADEADFLTAIDALVEQGIADPARVCVSGYSYGGYMGCWLTARSDRFAAAVCGGCVSDLVSMAGTSDDGPLVAEVEFGASVVEARDALAASSPIAHVARVRTPTLILHGEEDDRCPVGQAEQWFTALRAQEVPVELVRYPGQSHAFILDGRPSHRLDYARRLEGWVRRFTASPAEAARTHRAPQPRQAELQSRLRQLIARHGVPGASLAVLAGGEVTTAAAGVLNVETGAAATPDSLFQIGSISKVYTATMVMQLLDEGRLDLDAPVIEFVPELRLADAEVTRAVTVRHLLTHTSGIEGDHFPDLGRGDDCVERFVASCAELGQSHTLGATMSYCNTGYVLLGRVIEKLTGQMWDEALAQRLLGPLGLQHTVTLPEQALRFAAAAGHDGRSGEAPRLVPEWGMPRSLGPAGLICATAADVVAFARMHLASGRAADGTPVLSPGSAAAMLEPQVAVPDPYSLGSHWGLGWILFDWNGRRLFGHDGSTLGQAAFLRIVPDREVAIALLTNGGQAHDLYHELYRTLLDELAGVRLPEPPAPPAQRVEPQLDLDRHVGVYERLGVRVEFESRAGALRMRTTITGPLAELVPDPVEEHDLVAIDEDLYVTRDPGTDTWMPVVFYRLTDGARYVHFGARAAPKVQ